VPNLSAIPARFKMKKAHALFFNPLSLLTAAEGSRKHEPLSLSCPVKTKLANNNNSFKNKSQGKKILRTVHKV
jgi:hypothetical protein